MNNTENKIQTISQFISKQLKLKELPATKIFDLCHKQSFDNNDILSALKQLTDDKTVISHNKCFYLTKNLNVQNGYVHSNITGLLWVENIDKTNSFGVCFNVPEKITPIGNKKEATIGTKCAYVELVDGDSKFVYILSAEPHKSINLVAVKKHRSWVSINNNYYSRLKVEKDLHDELSTLEDGDIIQLQQSLDGMKLSHKIGNISDKGIESIIVKTIAEVNQPPSNSVEHVTNKSTKVLSNEFITIDSIHTKDIDDAISIEKTDDGYKLFVAIANVDAVIPKDSQEDLFAQKNATTFYLEFERIPMFHEGISESICSLNIGEEKPAFICEVNFDNNGVQKNYSFYESTIKVSYKTPYEDVDIIFNGDSPLNSFYTNDGNVQKILGDIPQNLSNQLNNLKTLTDFLKKNKIKQDYWFLKTPEYILGENGKIDHLAYREETDTISQSIVENCMLTANICAANILRKNAPNIGIFRNQTTKIDFEKPLPATYETNNEGHWGLQEETYTHFTSPIRRYCDLIVHRLIKAIIYNKPQPYTENEMQNIVKNINEQQYKHKQMNSKERIILNQEYLHNLVSTENLKSKFELASYNSNGCVFINKQFVEIFLPQFKVEKSIVDYINENIEDKDIQKHIDHVNNYWQFKGFIDKYHWLDSKKEVTMKFYPKEHKIEQERKLKIV